MGRLPWASLSTACAAPHTHAHGLPWRPGVHSCVYTAPPLHGPPVLYASAHWVTHSFIHQTSRGPRDPVGTTSRGTCPQSSQSREEPDHPPAGSPPASRRGELCAQQQEGEGLGSEGTPGKRSENSCGLEKAGEAQEAEGLQGVVGEGWHQEAAEIRTPKASEPAGSSS